MFRVLSTAVSMRSHVACKGRRGVAASARPEKWGNFHVPNETVPSGCTDPTQAAARLVIVYVSRIEKSCAVSNGKGHFRPTYQNDQIGQSRPPSKLVPNIPVGPNLNHPSHLISLMYQPKSPEVLVE